MSSFHDGLGFGFLTGNGGGGGGAGSGGGGGSNNNNNSASHGGSSSSIIGSAGASQQQQLQQQQQQLQLASSLLQSSSLPSSSSSSQQQQLQYHQQLLQQLQLQLQLTGNASLLASSSSGAASAANSGGSGPGGGSRTQQPGSHPPHHNLHSHSQHLFQQQQQQPASASASQQQQQQSQPGNGWSYAAAAAAVGPLMMGQLLAQQQTTAAGSAASAAAGNKTGGSGSGGVGGGAAPTLPSVGTEPHQQYPRPRQLHGLGMAGLASAPPGASSASASAEIARSSSGEGYGEDPHSPGTAAATTKAAGGAGGAPPRKSRAASVLLDFTRDNPPPPSRLFVPKGTRQASVWNHMRLISTPESVSKAKRSGRDAVGLWCVACERVVHHGWTSGETNPVKRHCGEKRHLAILAALSSKGRKGAATGGSDDAGGSSEKRGRGVPAAHGRKGSTGSDDAAAIDRRRRDDPPPAPRGLQLPVRAPRERHAEPSPPPPPPGKRFKILPAGGAAATATSANAEAATANAEAAALAAAEIKHRNAIQAYSTALVRSLVHSKVQMIRYIATDVSNRTRTKTTPLRMSSGSSLVDPIALPAVGGGGGGSSSSFNGKGETAALVESAILTPDWSTMRIPPYANDTALVVGNLSFPQCPSELCPRSFLQSVVDRAASAGLSVLASVVLNVGVKLSNASVSAVASPSAVEGAGSAAAAAGSGGAVVDAVLSPVDSLITLLLGQLQLQEIGVDSISEVDDSLQLELTLHENAVALIDNVVIVRENMLHLARQHGLQLDFQSNHEVHFHLSLVDSETGQNLLLRNSGTAQARRSSSFVSQHDMSGQGQSFLEGVLNHLPALLALTRPADVGRPASPSWDMEGSSSQAPLRVTFQGLDYRPCSWSANLYLALSGIVTAGLDGMEWSVVLRPPASGGILSDEDGKGADRTGQAAEEGAAVLPPSFQKSLQALQQDDLLSSTIPKPLLDRYISIHCRAESTDLSSSATPV